MAASVLPAVQNQRHAVGTQIGEVVARHVDGPRVETDTRMLRTTPSANGPRPTVITSTAGAN